MEISQLVKIALPALLVLWVLTQLAKKRQCLREQEARRQRVLRRFRLELAEIYNPNRHATRARLVSHK